MYYNSALPENAYLDGQTHELADGGELIPDPVPEPASLALLLTGLAGVVVTRRHRKRT